MNRQALTLSNLASAWRERANRRHLRAGEPVSAMNEHLLKDIGALDRLISSPAARERPMLRRIRGGAFACVVLLGAVLVATATDTWAAEAAPARPPTATPASPEIVGVFSGEFVNGAPVYRLPPISVVASREAALARLERQEQLARARQSARAAKPRA